MDGIWRLDTWNGMYMQNEDATDMRSDKSDLSAGRKAGLLSACNDADREW